MLRFHNGLIFITFSLLLSLGLGFAYFAQYYLSIEPCAMCYTQRYLFMVAIFILFITGIFCNKFPILKYVSLLTLITNLIFSGFHVGVEQKWWQGPKTCTSQTDLNLQNLSAEEALEKLNEHLTHKKFVPCDQIGWRILSIPVTILNTLFLLILCLFTIKVIIRCHKRSCQIFYKK
jgi:disulfide bond formation protein DsbB